MTTTTARTLEQIEKELEGAKEAESKLAGEANRMAQTLRAAATDGKEGLQEAAMAGKSPKEDAPLTKARKRAEELPALLWAASVRKLELLHEYQIRRAEEADREKKEALEESYAIEQEVHKLRERQEYVVDRIHVANAEWRDYNIAKGTTRRQLAALEANGPDFDLLKRSPLKARP